MLCLLTAIGSEPRPLTWPLLKVMSQPIDVRRLPASAIHSPRRIPIHSAQPKSARYRACLDIASWNSEGLEKHLAWMGSGQTVPRRVKAAAMELRLPVRPNPWRQSKTRDRADPRQSGPDLLLTVPEDRAQIALLPLSSPNPPNPPCSKKMTRLPPSPRPRPLRSVPRAQSGDLDLGANPPPSHPSPPRFKTPGRRPASGNIGRLCG